MSEKLFSIKPKLGLVVSMCSIVFYVCRDCRTDVSYKRQNNLFRQENRSLVKTLEQRPPDNFSQEQ